MNAQKFRHKEIWEAVRVTDSNANELIDWVGGEPSRTPGYLIAFKVWTGTTMIAKVGDWIACDRQGQFRSFAAEEFDRHYEAV